MKYSIPLNRVDKLQKIIKRYQRKGAKISFELGDVVVEDGVLCVADPINHVTTRYDVKVKCREVTVEGSYRINGWAFVGTIEFTENGNIIRLANSAYEGKVPEKYRHTPRICEHCGTIRNRKDTYLIHNEETGDFKQVGSKCLLDYTRGLDADECAAIMSCLEQFVTLSDMSFGYDDFIGGYNSPSGCGIDAMQIKKCAIAIVKALGFKRGDTAQDLSNYYFHNGLGYEQWTEFYGKIEPASEEEVAPIDDFAKENIGNMNSEYMRNASLAWLKESIEYRDFGLICAFVNTWFKQVEKETKKNAEGNNAHESEWVGEIGERITVNVANARVLFYKDNSHKSYYAASTAVYLIIDDKGNALKWSTSHEVNAGDVVVATVKQHTEYKGVKQTVITNGRIQNC